MKREKLKSYAEANLPRKEFLNSAEGPFAVGGDLK